MSESPIFRIVLQRHAGDCGPAVLAMALGVSYEEALVAAAECSSVLTGGMRTKDLQRAAGRLGYRLRRILRGYDMENDFGMLTVQSDTWKTDHLVILRQGELIETDGNIWEPETFFGHYQATPGPLFVADRVTRGKHG